MDKQKLEEILKIVLEGQVHPDCDNYGCTHMGREEMCYMEIYKNCRHYKKFRETSIKLQGEKG